MKKRRRHPRRGVHDVVVSVRPIRLACTEYRQTDSEYRFFFFLFEGLYVCPHLAVQDGWKDGVLSFLRGNSFLRKQEESSSSSYSFLLSFIYHNNKNIATPHSIISIIHNQSEG